MTRSVQDKSLAWLYLGEGMANAVNHGGRFTIDLPSWLYEDIKSGSFDGGRYKPNFTFRENRSLTSHAVMTRVGSRDIPATISLTRRSVDLMAQSLKESGE